MSKLKSLKPNASNNAVAYCRVASKTQTDSNLSIESQKRLIAKAAKKSGIKVTKWYESLGKAGLPSSDRSQHKNLTEVYAHCKSNKVCYLYVASPDRISRLSSDFYEWVQKFEKIGVKIIPAKTSNDSDPVEAIKESSFQVQEQFERQLVAYRAKKRRAAKRREN